MQTPPKTRETDISGDVAQFLLSVRPEDLVTELVQNELDAGSRATVIEFSDDEIVCSGNGSCVDRNGWERLRLVKAVGSRLEKQGGIGAKNHGLRVGFHWGDEIIVQSDGRETRILLRGDANEFDPAAWKYPIPQPLAPKRGCRITIPLRTRKLLVPGRDGFPLMPRRSIDIDQLFECAVEESPQRFIGVMCPGYWTRYELILKRRGGQTYRFKFSCSSIPGWKGRHLFRRMCTLSPTRGQARTLLREEVHSFPIRLSGLKAKDVPRFYRASTGLLGEISWQLDEQGLPQTSRGKLRYPIEYPDDEAHAHNDLGLTFSAPFSSDPQRHGTAEGSERNRLLVQLCEDRLPWILRRRLVPHFGARVLELLRTPDGPTSEASERIVLAAAKSGALPAAERSRTGKARRHRCVPAGSTSRAAYNFVIPCFTWQKDRVDPILSRLCPTQFVQLHPSTPSFVIETLCESLYDGEVRSGVSHCTFDEHDVLGRMQPDSDSNSFYPWVSEDEWRRELSDLPMVSLYLDVVHAYLNDSPDDFDAETTEAMRSLAMLPNSRHEANSWGSLCWLRGSVPEIPGVETNILHPDVAKHSLFAQLRRSNSPLMLDEFDIDQALSQLDWSHVENATRRQFFDWLRDTSQRLSQGTWEELRAYPIWPGGADSYVPFDAYCEPESRSVAQILGGHILRPPKRVRRMDRVGIGGRGVLAIRTVPTTEEIENWYRTSCQTTKTRALTKSERAGIDRLEQQVSTLRANKKLRQAVDDVAAEHVTIDGKGHLRRVTDLHIATAEVRQCALLPQDLAVGRHRKLYQSLGAQTKPNSEALKRVLVRDPNQKLLHKRIAAFVRTNDAAESLEENTFIALPGRKRMYSPSELVLSSQLDYWGTWKKRYTIANSTPEREANLLEVGMIGRVPTPYTSRAFFGWLANQPQRVIREHLPQVIRHFKHPHGPLSWWSYNSRHACLPVQSLTNGVELVSHRDAIGRSARVFLPDCPDIERRMLQVDSYRSIAIVEHPKVSSSILSDLKSQGVASLRLACNAPAGVRGAGNESRSRHHEERVRVLTKGPIRKELAKRLEEQGIPGRELNAGWPRILEGVQEVRVADSVMPVYKLGHHSYRVERPWAVGGNGKVIWLKDTESQLMFLYEAIASLVLVEGDDKAYQLQKAVEMDYHSRVLVGDVAQVHAGRDMDAAGADGTGETPRSGRDRVHGAIASIATPSPRRIRVRRQAEYESRPSNTRGKKRLQGRPESPQEEEDKRALKEEHYAWHCQACLGLHEVSEIAPEPTYGFHVQHRRAIIEAHHVDHYAKGGARGAANLIILCAYHHQLLGDQLSQNQIRSKLDKEARKVTRRFPLDETRARLKPIQGQLITVDLDVAPYSVQLFFTSFHAQRWREG